MDRIDSFSGEHAFLSNFFWHDGTTAEHLFQASKTRDPEAQDAILGAPTPGKAKRLGRKAPLRSDWESVKLDVMLGCLRLKFKLGTVLGRRLDATGDAELIEGNHWGDTFWGVCNGEGENHLGRLLMRVREENRNVPSA